MKRIILLLLCCFSSIFAFANDGVFYASGNQLIPINETDISVKKEVLTINRVGDHLEVTVHYEFFNPVGAKELLVGFEAQAAYNGIDPMTTFPKHPHIDNFKVIMNGSQLTYKVANVPLSYYDDGEIKTNNYVKNGVVQSWTRKECEKAFADNEYFSVPFDYVYYFKAKFRPGQNIIIHTYNFDLSESVEEEFYFPYVLTAANRWANNQIDDFTLNINLGNNVSFHLFPEFFKSAKEWKIIGKGKYTLDTTWGLTNDIPTPVFHIQEGGISFHKTNFHPEGELKISQRRYWSITSWNWSDDPEDLVAQVILEDFQEQYIPLFIPEEKTKNDIFYSTFSPEQRKILKNLPFAYRGYVFKNKSLQNYFESTKWYIPDPEYKAEMQTLDANKQKWVKFWSE